MVRGEFRTVRQGDIKGIDEDAVIGEYVQFMRQVHDSCENFQRTYLLHALLSEVIVKIQVELLDNVWIVSSIKNVHSDFLIDDEEQFALAY